MYTRKTIIRPSLLVNEPALTCCECRKEIVGTPYLFRGLFFACEACVRKHYGERKEIDIERELRLRAREAQAFLARNPRKVSLAQCDYCGGNHATEKCRSEAYL